MNKEKDLHFSFSLRRNPIVVLQKNAFYPLEHSQVNHLDLQACHLEVIEKGETSKYMIMDNF